MWRTSTYFWDQNNYYQKKMFSEFHLDVYDMKATEILNIFVIGMWGLGEVLTQFYPFLTQGHLITREMCSLNFINISRRLTDVFDKSAIGTEVHIFDTWRLEKVKFDFDKFGK